jgi:hypothetical protein
VWFKADHHHLYIQEKKDPREEWLAMKYRITEEDMGLIMEDWDVDWKIPSIDTEKLEMQQLDIEEIPRGEEEEGPRKWQREDCTHLGIRGKISTKENQFHRERRGRL